MHRNILIIYKYILYKYIVIKQVAQQRLVNALVKEELTTGGKINAHCVERIILISNEFISPCLLGIHSLRITTKVPLLAPTETE